MANDKIKEDNFMVEKKTGATSLKPRRKSGKGRDRKLRQVYMVKGLRIHDKHREERLTKREPGSAAAKGGTEKKR
jgi:hypothetical protein